jgi:hypothetical protein
LSHLSCSESLIIESDSSIFLCVKGECFNRGLSFCQLDPLISSLLQIRLDSLWDIVSGRTTDTNVLRVSGVEVERRSW